MSAARVAGIEKIQERKVVLTAAFIARAGIFRALLMSICPNCGLSM